MMRVPDAVNSDTVAGPPEKPFLYDKRLKHTIALESASTRPVLLFFKGNVFNPCVLQIV